MSLMIVWLKIGKKAQLVQQDWVCHDGYSTPVQNM